MEIRWFIPIFVLCCTAQAWAQETLFGKWSGEGYMHFTSAESPRKYCAHSKLVLSESEGDLIIEEWDNCIVNWSVQPLSFKAGEIFHGEQLIGAYSSEAFRFEYHSLENGYHYAVEGILDHGKLIIDELIDLPKVWWSKARYIHRRQN